MYTPSDDPFRTPYNGRPSQDGGRRPSQDDSIGRTMPVGSPNGDFFGVPDPGFRTASPESGAPVQRQPSSSSSYGGRPPVRKPSQDYPYQPSGRKSSGENQLSYGNSSSQATAGVIIPNKSTIAEEDIKVPFGRSGDEDSPASSRAGSPDGMRVSLQSASSNVNGGPRSPDGRSPLDRLGQGQTFGLNALGANLMSSPKSDEDDTGSDRRAPSEYFDKLSYGRASVQSDLSGKGARGHRQVCHILFPVFRNLTPFLHYISLLKMQRSSGVITSSRSQPCKTGWRLWKVPLRQRIRRALYLP